MRLLLALSLALVPLAAEAQFLPTGMEPLPSGTRPAFAFTAPAPGAYASLTASTGQTITCTRASSATYQPTATTVATASSGQCRVGYQGLQVEGSSTNILAYSEQLDNAAWTKQTNVTVTADSATCGAAPDGQQHAELVDVSTATTSAGIYQYATAANSSQTRSVYLWIPVGDAACSIALNDPSTVTTDQIVPLTSGAKTRGALTFTSPSGFAGIWIRKPSASSCSRFCAWGAQVEVLPFASSYIPTTGTAASRAADDISFTKPSALQLTTSDYSGSVTASVEGYVNNNTLLASSSSRIAWLRAFQNTNLISAYSDTSGTPATATFTTSTGVSGRYQLHRQAGNLYVCGNGTCGSPLALSTQPTEPTTLYLGSQNGLNYLFGWISAACLSASPTGCAP